MFGIKTATALGIATALFTGAAQAASVGWNYVGTGGGALAASDSAGAPSYAQINWNNHAGSGQGAGATPLALVDDVNAASGVSVTAWTVSAANSWTYGETATPDQSLLNDFNDQDPSVTFSGVNAFTADGYTVVVYYGNNEFSISGASDLTVNGTTQSIKTGDKFSATGYVQNTGDGSTASNYAVFTGVTGDVLTVSVDAPQNDGISAIQIIAVPEPGSLALLGLGGLTMLRRRRA